MGTFHVRVTDGKSGRELRRFAVPNVLANEASEHVYRQLFPTYDAAMTFQLGIAGPDPLAPNYRPQKTGGGAPNGANATLTFADCTDSEANEGGCYTSEMRASFGYARENVAFTATMEADGGAFTTPEVTFPNEHSWTPQDADDWDDKNSTTVREQPPPEWKPSQRGWEPEVGYPWQRPRKRSGDSFFPLVQRSYMYAWQADHSLDWLYDFRKMGGFPITALFLADSSRSKLVAAAKFRAPILLRPGMSVHVTYKARIFSVNSTTSRDFMLRFAKYAFQKTGTRYSSMRARPVLATVGVITRRTTYEDLVPHFSSALGAFVIAAWTSVAGPPHYARTTAMPYWVNSSGAQVGPFSHIAVWGIKAVGGDPELAWCAPIEPITVLVPNGDYLIVNTYIQFYLDGV